MLIWRSGKALGDLPVASPDGTQDSESDRSKGSERGARGRHAVLGCGVFGEDGGTTAELRFQSFADMFGDLAKHMQGGLFKTCPSLTASSQVRNRASGVLDNAQGLSSPQRGEQDLTNSRVKLEFHDSLARLSDPAAAAR